MMTDLKVPVKVRAYLQVVFFRAFLSLLDVQSSQRVEGFDGEVVCPSEYVRVIGQELQIYVNNLLRSLNAFVVEYEFSHCFDDKLVLNVEAVLGCSENAEEKTF